MYWYQAGHFVTDVNLDPNKRASSVARKNTMYSALKLLSNAPSGSYMIQFYYKNGERWGREYYRRDEGP